MPLGILTSIVGYAATVVGTFLMLPQVYKTLRTKKVDDISWIMLVCYFFNCALWLSYGSLINSAPLMVTNGIAVLISVFQIFLKMKYSRPVVKI